MRFVIPSGCPTRRRCVWGSLSIGFNSSHTLSLLYSASIASTLAFFYYFPSYVESGSSPL
jgi:hypothetical protein